MLESESPNFAGEIPEKSGMGGRVAQEKHDEQIFFRYGVLERGPVDLGVHGDERVVRE